MRIDGDLARVMIEAALLGGGHLAELYLREGRSIRAEAKDGRAESLKTSMGGGYGLRIITKEGATGFSYSNDPGAWRDVVSSAIASAVHTSPNEHNVLPEALNAPLPSIDAWDPAVEAMGEEDAVRGALMVEEAARSYDPRVMNTRGASVSFGTASTRIVNSLGLDVSYRSTGCSAQTMSMARDETLADSQTGWDFMSGRSIGEMDFRAVGRGASERAVSMLGACRGGSMRGPVILDGQVAAEFMGVLSGMLSGEAVLKGKSLLRGMIGKRIMAETLDLVDDPLDASSPARKPMDAEGVPVRTMPLIEAGALRGYMHNAYSASRTGGGASPGNAVRGGYSSPPGIGPLSLVIRSRVEPVPIETMAASIGKGLLVMDAMGVHTVNPISGEFSLGVSGLMIEGGRIGGPVREMVITGTLLGLLGGVCAVGDDMRYYGSVGAPSLMIECVDVSG